MTTQKLLTLFSLTLAASCTSEAGSDNTNRPSSQSQALRSADATGKLLALSNASAGLSQIGTRANIVADLAGEIESGVDEFLTGLHDSACVNIVQNAVDESNVELHFDFSDCDVEGGVGSVVGELDIDFSIDGDGEVDCDFDGNLEIDGYDFDGEWGVDLDGFGGASILGQINLTLPDGTELTTELVGDWQDLGGLCPSLTQHLAIQTDVESLTIDLSGVDLCSGSLCGSGVGVSIAGLEEQGGADIDYGDFETEIAEATEGLACDENGNLTESAGL